jgi:hypothetical protein
MRSLLCRLTLGVALCSGVSGCSLLPAPQSSVLVGDPEPAAPPSGITLDEARIPTGDAARAWTTSWLPASGRPLTAAECASRGAEQSQLARVLDREAAHLRCGAGSHGRGCVSGLLPEILSQEARRQRNDAAQQALTAYYQLVEVHLQQEVLAESLREHESTRQSLESLHSAGLLPQYDRSDLERKRLQLDQQSLKLTYDRTRLTARIKTLIGQDALTPEAIETTCALEPRPPGYALPEALEIARAHDVELFAIRRFLQCGDVDDLDLARSLLQTSFPLLGQTPETTGPLAKLSLVWGHVARSQQELSTRKQQLRTLYASRQEQVDLEVAAALVDVEQKYLELGLARDTYDSWQTRVDVLELNRELLREGYPELLAARGERLKARSQLLHAIVELELAHVRLDGTLGTLGH